jgi:5-methyltetrahydropteroyltriglutamate--homocysteine methyltransferase
VELPPEKSSSQCHQPPHLTEHAELVADRIITFAEIVGRENVTAVTEIAWAKLRALRDGAAIASKKLWS